MANEFEEVLAGYGESLCCRGIEILQANIGLICNQACTHCHVEASPERTEIMGWDTMMRVVEVAGLLSVKLVDITGGAPEMNPLFRDFVKALVAGGHSVQVRTNLTVMLENGMGDMPEFMRRHGVAIVASLPCYTEENVNAQRGARAMARSVEVLKRLNAQGYGRDEGLTLNLVYNPGGAFLPSCQESLEIDYHRELTERYGVAFSHLLTITNIPIGRFAEVLKREGKTDAYFELLKGSFNPDTIDGLMCRHQLAVGWDGTLYDCDFNLALGLPVDHGAPSRLRDFDLEALAGRQIVTGNHCFGCTAGRGSSCGGELV